MFNGKPVKDPLALSVIAFVITYLLSFAIVALGLSLMELNFLTAISGAATAISNVGPGLGEMIGPVGNFADLPAAGKWLTSIAMVLGRLEFFTVLILLTPQFWRD
jgi:trk system potassium uptake protein TrkH